MQVEMNINRQIKISIRLSACSLSDAISLLSYPQVGEFIDVLVPPVNTDVHLLSKRPNERLELLWVVQNRFLRIAHESPVDLDYLLLYLQRGPLQVKSIKLCESLQLLSVCGSLEILKMLATISGSHAQH